MFLLKDTMYKISVKRNGLGSLLLSDGSTGNGIFGTMQYAVNQEEMVADLFINSF